MKYNEEFNEEEENEEYNLAEDEESQLDDCG